MIVVISAEAEADLEEIGDHIARENPARAVTFISELRTKCLDLSTMAKAFPLVERYAHQAIRRRSHGQYLIFYRCEAHRVVVLHVLHGARDYDSILGLD
jgi:toxin ParE1/3/4